MRRHKLVYLYDAWIFVLFSNGLLNYMGANLGLSWPSREDPITFLALCEKKMLHKKVTRRLYMLKC